MADTPDPVAKTDIKPVGTKRSIMDRWKELGKQKQMIVGGIAALVLLIIIIGVTPLKYPVVSLVHKGSVDVTVVDDVTGQPLLGVQVESGKQDILTDTSGQAKLTNLGLGKTTVTLTKQSYETKTVTPTVFWSIAKLGTVKMHSTGVSIKFDVKDYVSGKPVSGVAVTIGKASGATSDSGAGTVSIDPAAVKGASAILTKDGYNDLTVNIKSATGTTEIALVPAGDVYFFSNRSGKIDLYSSKLDGSGQKIVVAGTGNEDQETGLLPSVIDPSSVAIISSRAGTRTNGDLQHDLYIYDGSANKLTKIDSNVEFTNFRAWIGTSLVYFKAESDHFAIKAYDTKTGNLRELVTMNGNNPFGGAAYATGLGVAAQEVYYSASSANASQNGFFSLGLNSSPHQISDKTAGEAYRLTKDSISVSLDSPTVGQPPAWKKLNIANKTLSDLPGQPSNTYNRGYADSADGTHSIFVETRDGKSELYLTDATGANEQAITSFGKVNQFVQWYGNKYVAFSSNNGESSIYIVSIDGGPVKKVTDFYQGNGATYGGGYNPSYF